jgi:hypothetical protein
MDRWDAEERLATLTVRCFWMVAVTAPFNLPLGGLCLLLLGYVVGPGFADTHGCILILLLVAVQVAAFAALYSPIRYFSRRRSVAFRRGAFLAVCVVYFVFWLAWTAVMFTVMALTGMSF